MKLNTITASFEALERTLGLPPGVHVVSIVQDPKLPQFYVRVTSEKDPKAVAVDDLTKLGLAYADDVPEEIIAKEKGEVRGGA